MVKGGNWKKVDRSLWKGRLVNGRDYLRAAKDLLELAGEGQNGNPIIGQKGRIHYDFRIATIDEARKYLEQVERFAEWAENAIE